MIHLLRSRATAQQLAEMLDELGVYVKLAVDIQRGILTGGGALHADCEAVLLVDGSQQEDVWEQTGFRPHSKSGMTPSSISGRAKITWL